MCQPGRPGPQGESQTVSSPGLCAFHSAKSSGSRLRAAPSTPSPWSMLSGRAVGEAAIARVRAHAEVDVAVGGVGVAAVHERGDVVDDRRHRLGGERLGVGASEPSASVSAR